MSQKEYYHVEAERELNNYIEKLIKIKTNFSKNPYRKFLHNTLIKKKTDVRAIRVAILETLQKYETTLEFTKFNFLVKTSRALVDEINAPMQIWIRKALGGTQTASVRLPVDAANNLMETVKIKAAWSVCTLRATSRAVEQMERCFRCMEFGHQARNCKGPDRSALYWKWPR